MSAPSIMGARIESLNRIAQDGDIEAFYSLIRKDVKILEDIDELPFVDTPLHVAASSGGSQHIQFGMEMMRLKPSFARKPNSNGYSPIHLALQLSLQKLKENSQMVCRLLQVDTQMVCRLLQVDGDLVRVKGKAGRTPLHDVAAAAETELQLALMDKFLSYCPSSIEDVTIHNQTALHVALLENNKLDAFERLVRWLRKNKCEIAREILNRQDGEGNTVLHVAVSQNQTKAVRELLNCGVNVNVWNLEDHTALDILSEQRQVNSEIRDMLSYAGALSCSCSFLPKFNCCQRKPKVLFYERLRLFIRTAREGSRISNDDRNALLVVAALLLTITYQAVITPPGGLWQENKEETDFEDAHYAGTSIARINFVSNFDIVATINYITFTLSAIMTFQLLPSGYISALFKMALVQLWVSYYYSLAVISNSAAVGYYCLVSTGLCIFLVVFTLLGRHFCGARIKSLHLDSIFYIVYACIMFVMTFFRKSNS